MSSTFVKKNLFYFPEGSFIIGKEEQAGKEESYVSDDLYNDP